MRLVNQLKSKQEVDWKTWINRELIVLYGLYLDIGWCKPKIGRLAQFEDFLMKVYAVEKKIKPILHSIINKTPGLKIFMCMHSVFDQSTIRRWDWLVQFMSEELIPTNKEIEEIFKKPEIPKHILDLFYKFKPEPVSNGLIYHPIRIEYKLWGDYKLGESSDPINIIFTKWDHENYGPKLNKNQVESFISQYDTIKSS